MICFKLFGGESDKVVAVFDYSGIILCVKVYNLAD